VLGHCQPALRYPARGVASGGDAGRAARDAARQIVVPLRIRAAPASDQRVAALIIVRRARVGTAREDAGGAAR
jgi:hypothetical protein